MKRGDSNNTGKPFFVKRHKSKFLVKVARLGIVLMYRDVDASN